MKQIIMKQQVWVLLSSLGWITGQLLVYASSILRGYEIARRNSNKRRKFLYGRRGDYIGSKINKTATPGQNSLKGLNCQGQQWYECWSIIVILICSIFFLYFFCWQLSKRCSRNERRLGNSTEDCY